MRAKALFTAITAALLAGSAAITVADDGTIERHPITSAPGQTANPEPLSEHAYIQLLNFYVPAQTSEGTLTTINYCTADDAAAQSGDCTTAAKTSTVAKPLIAFALYGPVITFDDLSTDGFPGHGRRDAFAAVSLDDGSTWKRTNLSNSADRSSFVLPDDAAIPDPVFAQAEFVVTAPNPVITTATYAAKTKTLTVSGTGAASKAKVEIRNALTFDVIGTTTAKPNGSFTFTAKKLATVPCNVQAGASSSSTWGPYLAVAGAPADCVGSGSVTTTTDYPGDVVNGMHAMHGNKILAAWQSKFCSAGSPAWGDEFIASDQATVATYLGINIASDLYLTDVFGVAGSQGSTDYREQEEYPGEYDAVGVVPHSCLWTARGLLREDPLVPDTTEVVWFQAERLTSGRRDVNRIEVGCVAGAGCAVSWQEDPEGLRPGTGWSGATTASKTDVWFSFVRWDDFEVVNDGTSLVPLAALSLDTLGTNRPAPGVPMMVPVRLSNNDRCLGDTPESGAEPPIYCTSTATAYGLKPQCITSIMTANTGAFACVADTNSDSVGDLPNIANTAASRPRLSLQPRDSDGDGITDDAWVMVFAEEDKGLGAFGFPNNFAWDGNLASTAANCGDPDSSKTDVCIEADIGKNILWYTFAMGTADTSAALEDDFSLVNNLVFQGAQLNQPEVNWHTGTFFPPMSTADMWGFGEELDYLIFNTEIARRSSMMAQSILKAKSSQSNLVAMPLWKQGTMNQGGPADIMARRFEATTIDEANANPYDVANMKCEWYAEDGTPTPGVILFDPADPENYNPYYPKGLCTAPAINLSGRTPFECESSGAGSDGICNTVNLTCEDDTEYGQLCVPATVTDGSADDPLYLPALDKMLSWYECPGANGAYTGTRTDLQACGADPASVILGSNLDDQSWYNPVDIAKGHRGFLDGDFVQMLYAWSPNYKQNTVGHDRYELYVRRSFDGGITWTTTPASFTASDGKPYVGAGTVTCETLRDGADSQTDNHICTTYDAGVAEQSRNVSQLQSMKYTILDPRYTPTVTNLGVGMPDATPAWATGLDWLLFTPVEPTDIRNPSRFFVVYETGDNTTTAVGEAEPLDLFYGRAEVFGDHYTVWAEVDTNGGAIGECYPNTTHDVENASWAANTGFCNEFDDLEGKQDSESGEASLTASAAGDFLYAVWAQENFAEDPETGEHEFVDSDAMFRRVWYLDDYIPADAWTLPGTGDQTTQE